MRAGNGPDMEYNINNSKCPYAWNKYFYETNITIK